MKMIKVKAVKGRVVREAPDGDFIPADRFVPVEETHYVRRLIDLHGDLIEQGPDQPTEPVAEPEPKSEQPAPKPRRTPKPEKSATDHEAD